MFKKLLIANRGEIAVRILKTAKKLGINTVAIFSAADKEALFVRLADEAYYLGGAKATDSYLQIEKIISIAKKANVCAIHPGYGFLSENAQFAKRCHDEEIIFVGANAKSIELMGSKSKAKTLMEAANVPVTPGYHGDLQDDKHMLTQAEKIGFPVLIKAASGGGGKGMRVVDNNINFTTALNSARREAQKSFADDILLIEKYLPSPRHIEVQLFADNHGQIVHLFERDCSIQRRHQKIIEEAPASRLTDKLKKRMYKAAIDAARAVDYVGAGTIEFLVQGDNFYFMEMNTRLQVEHPVTELITGLDLVEWQLRVAANEPLPLTQQQVIAKGHAIEARVYAEDSERDFLPQTGTIHTCRWPADNGDLRIDTGVEAGSEVSIYYDPMIAKIISYGACRAQSIQRLQQALLDTHITGITHNIDFLSHILNSQEFSNATISTHFLTEHPVVINRDSENALIFASLYLILKPSKENSPWAEGTGFQINLPAMQTFHFKQDDTVFSLQIEALGNSNFLLKKDNTTYQCEASLCEHALMVLIDGKRLNAFIYMRGNNIDVFTAEGHSRLSRHIKNYDQFEDKKGQLTAPMPGNVISVLCQENQTITKGQTLMVIEAMKMEHNIIAPEPGVVSKIHFKVGNQVQEGDELLALEEKS